MGDIAHMLSQLDQTLHAQLPPELHDRIPVVLALLRRFSAGDLVAGEVQAEQLNDPELLPLLQAVETISAPASGVNFNGAQTGDISIGDVARAIIHNTIIVNTDPAQAAASFAAGIDALRVVIDRTPEARTALIIFRDRLASARDQVGDLINLKLLHDLIHGLQYRSLPMLVRELRRFPDDEDAVAGIEQCEIDLRDTHLQICRLVEQEFFEVADVAWRDLLLRIADDIRAGLESQDSNTIERTAMRAKSIINTRLSGINANLYQQARLLRVDDLMQPLRSLYQKLADFAIERAELAQIDSGINGLGQLHQLLSAMVFVHNGWQTLADELNAIEATLRSDQAELEYSWPYLEPQINRLCQSNERWATEIRDAADRLVQALQAHEESKVRFAFDRLQNRISHRFFTIDLDLKSLCNRLRDFRDPLDALGLAT
ncbi:MAG: hypothetical protein HC822_22440 [Oscillochloris sp.]|nr:hypothetical protein [Oscillochloris sp.]